MTRPSIHVFLPLIMFMLTAPGMAGDENRVLTQVIAHRGASYDAPENTAASISLAIKDGARIIEFDVRRTRDGALLLFHDSDLKRLCGREQAFEDLTSEEARQLDVGSWFKKGRFPDERPIDLKTAVQLCIDGGATALVEHKTGSAREYAEVLTAMKATDRVIVQSFDWSFIRDLKQILPGVKTGALGAKEMAGKREELLRLRTDWVGWSQKDVLREDVRWLKENQFSVAIWTVNDPGKARELISWGVDRIITDRPRHIEFSILHPTETK